MSKKNSYSESFTHCHSERSEESSSRARLWRSFVALRAPQDDTEILAPQDGTEISAPQDETDMHSGILKKLLIAPVRLYQLAISGFLGNCCRFEPSCSTYAIKAIRIHGACRGIYLAFYRILRCHPWHAGGYDPVPKK